VKKQGIEQEEEEEEEEEGDEEETEEEKKEREKKSHLGTPESCGLKPECWRGRWPTSVPGTR
jgi:hypothetical protein